MERNEWGKIIQQALRSLALSLERCGGAPTISSPAEHKRTEYGSKCLLLDPEGVVARPMTDGLCLWPHENFGSTAVKIMVTPANAARWLRHGFMNHAAQVLLAISFRDSRFVSRWRVVVMSIGLAHWVSYGAADAEERSRHVLMLDAYNNTLPAPVAFNQAVRNRLRTHPSIKTDAYTEFLDLGRFSGPLHESRTAHYLAEKYAQAPPDLVMVLADASLNFAMKYREILAPNAPIVFSNVSPAMLAAITRPSDVVGFTVSMDFARTLALAERLHPHARNLVIVNGGTELDRQWLETLQDQLKPQAHRFNTQYLTGLPYEELLATASRLPRETIVIYTTVFGDRTGRQFVPADVLEDFAKATAAPIYAATGSYLGRGIVGGYFESFEKMGIAAADLALEILTGRDPSTITPRPGADYNFAVDARQLERWKLSEDVLPTATEISFGKPTLWQEHRFLILSAIAALSFQSAFIILVLIQNRRRREAERSLKESEERMAFAAASTSAGFWQIETTDWSLWTSHHCRTLLGFATGATPTLEILLEHVHPEDRDGFARAVRSAVRHSRPIDFEFRVLRTDEEIRWLAARGQLREGDARRSPCVSGIFVDITALKAAEGDADLQRRQVTHLMRQSMLGELSGAIAHELNQPLTAILSNAETAQDLLSRKEMDLDQVRDILNDIIEDDNRAGEVIRRLRRLLRKEEAKPEPIDLNQLVESTLSLLHGELVRRKINVEVAIAADLPASLGDSVQLQQVLLNLIMNAIEAMNAEPPLQRELVIRTRAAADQIEATIIDSGHGLTPEARTQLFQPFFTTKEFGLGLGLSICSTIIKSHGGKLTVQNNANGGAIATFTLPIQLAMAPA